ncbi:MAG: acyl-[acyl-carrier-protein] thioesterase [Treponema sp.]|nr:acyl-[acyl-carrier-protein] thioesterase [Treponema sp.]
MKKFEQYHDDDMIFHKRLKFNFSQADKYKNITLKEILAFTSDTAVEDYHQRGISFDRLCENKIGLIVSRVSFHFYKMIKADDIVVIHTWEEAPKGLFFVRRYEIENEDGEKLLSGNSLWVCVNLENRTFIRPKDFTLRPLPARRTECVCIEPGKIKHPENLQKLGSRKIVFSDIDRNGHVNNSRYAQMIMDNIAENFQSKDIKDFRINYVHEAILNDELEIFANYDEKNQMLTVVGKSDDKINFEAELIY